MKRIAALFLVLIGLFAITTAAFAQDDEENKPTPEQAKAYKEIFGLVNPGDMKTSLDAIASSPSRVAGYPGCDKAADYISAQFKQLGLKNVRDEVFNATTPVDDGHGSLEAPGQPPIRLYCLWPNEVRTSTVPPEGLTVPLIYGGSGSIAELNGKKVQGSAVLLDFNSGSEWLNGPRLGAKAVIFIEPQTTLRGEAEAKFLSVPLDMPRFWVSRTDAPRLIAMTRTAHPPVVTIHANMQWELRPVRNIIGVMPGSDPQLKKQIVVIEAYYDSMSVVPALAPGAESAAGAAALLELIKTYKRLPPKRTVWFLATGAHYLGLAGIRNYMEDHWQELKEYSTTDSFKLWLQSHFPSFLLLAVPWLLIALTVYLIIRTVRAARAARPAVGAGVGASLLALFTLIVAPIFLGAPGFKPRAIPQIYLFAGLDLASHTKGVGVFYKGWYYDMREDIQSRFSDIGRVNRENAEKVAQVMDLDPEERFADGVNPISGKNWRNFIPAKPAYDAEAITMAGGHGITFSSIDDARELVDTPLDTLDRVNVGNLAEQTKMIACLLWHSLRDPNGVGIAEGTHFPVMEASAFGRLKLQGGFAKISGNVMQFNPAKSVVPDDPILGSLAVLKKNNKTYVGVRGDQVELTTGPRAYFEFVGAAPLTAYGGRATTEIAAYKVSRTDGHLEYAPDQGVTGGKENFQTTFEVTTGIKQTGVVVFPCDTTALYDLVDPESLRTLSTITVLDAESNGEPRMYGFDQTHPEQLVSHVEDVALIYARPANEVGVAAEAAFKPSGNPVLDAQNYRAFQAAQSKQAGQDITRVKILGSAGPGAVRMTLINATLKNPEGEGYPLLGKSIAKPMTASLLDTVLGSALKDPKLNRPSAPQPTPRAIRAALLNRSIDNTALAAALDMFILDDYRINRLTSHRIINPAVNELHNFARGELLAAFRALLNQQWDALDASSRAAWGYESRAYPMVRSTEDDVVKGVIFYLFLLMPFAYFSERLVIGSKFLKTQIAWTLAIFIGIFIIFRYVHPAFDITMNPLVVLLAFVMLALSVLVIVMITGRFEKELKEFNKQISGVHRVDIGRLSIATAAFSLGISNMRRRKARTVLTCTTLILLTFTVLSFTSVVPKIAFHQVLAPGTPYYPGVLLRTPQWGTLEESAYRILKDEFGATHPVAARAWYFGTQLGEQSFITLKRGDKRFDARAVVGLTPEEEQVTHPFARSKIAGRWFLPGDSTVCILPGQIADALGIPPDAVGRAKVEFSGQEYTVIGIVDKDKFKSVLDLDNEMLTPVDFIQMNRLQSQGQTQGQSNEGFQEYLHLEPDAVFFVPYKTLINLGGDVYSIAINFVTPQEVHTVLKDLMYRLGLNLYGGENGHTYRFSTIGATSAKGGGDVFIPIIIASLIVLNTMLGSVFERVKEIGIFSSIGLAPNHIAALFIGEAMVYAVIGAVAGYLTGQIAAKLAAYIPILSSLYLNFSSMSAVLTTVLVVVVVLLSTLYPARKASEVATPAIERSWRLPDPVGDTWKIKMPFAVTGMQASALNGFLSEWFSAYEEYSIGDFVTQDVKTQEREYDNGGGYEITLKAWLAPFDLGVSQLVTLETVPTDMQSVYELQLTLVRESGDVSNWKRINRRFLNTLRKQFLIWRTLRAEEREKYLAAEEPASI